ncbi:MAG: carboxypeptidase-like regulatory domain-containing protein [Planctomycetota bacterium]
MSFKKSVPVVCILLITLTAGINQTIAAENGGVHLRFSLKTAVVTVSGMVTDKESGEPIANALVRGHVVIWRYRGPDLFEKCPYQETTTDADGRYELQFITALTTSGPTKGDDGLCVYVSAPGHETMPKYGKAKVTPKNTEYRDFNFELGPGKLVKGTVLDERGDPVEGALVRVQTGQNGDWNFFGALGKTVTSEGGRFEVWMAPDNPYVRRRISPRRWLCVSKLGCGTGLFWDLFSADDMGTLVLPPGGSISGTVVGGDGRAVTDCEVSVRGYPCGLIDRVLTGQDGRYVLSGIRGDPSIVEFYTRKNNRYKDGWGKVTVHARLAPEMKLQNVPQYEIMAQDGKTITGPDLMVATDTSASGRLTASKATFGLGGLMVRLDYSWDNMVEADSEGNFRFPFVSAGSHRLTAYLPHNLRYDRGIGHIDIQVEPGIPLENLQIRLEDLAELRVQYLDDGGYPLPGITAGATWSKSGGGAWTEGTKSDKDGWAVLYLYPGRVQYVRGFDHAGNLVAEGFAEVKPQPGQVMENLRIVMVPTAAIRGRLLDEKNQPLSQAVLLCKLDFAAGGRKRHHISTDASGCFQMDRLAPGIVTLSVERDSVLFNDVLSFVLDPGQTRDLGDVPLKGGLDKQEMIREKHARAMQHPDEIVQAAKDLFGKIRNADYEYFLTENTDWRDFPIVGYYQTHHWFDVLVKWICETFKENPIVAVEFGEVFENPDVINGKKDLPTVPYKLTLKDGTVLQGNLPFEFNFDRDIPHWHGIQGIDWHLQDGTPSK